MDLKPGYKRTELGIIPEDWTVAQIGAIAETSSGTTPPRAFFDRYYRNGHIPWAKTLDLNNSEIYSTDEQVTSFALNETSLRYYPAGSVLVAMYGGLSQIGRTGLLRIPATVNQALTAIRPERNRLRPEYLLNVLNFRVDHWKSVASSSRKDPNITSTDIRRFPLALPGVVEQDVISATLAAIDHLIESLDQLLEKKRSIRTAAMQELLTGKRRLPGFTGEWREMAIAKVAFPSTEKNTAGKQLPVLTCSKHNGFMDSLGYFKNQVFSRDTRGYRVIRRGQIGYPSNHVEEGSIGLQNLYDVALVSPIYVVFSVQENADSYFLHRLLKLEAYRQKFESATSSSVNRRGSLRWSSFSKITVALPSLEEQTSIAAVLGDMDTEIAVLEAKLKKTGHVKYGMMQELLTGRIRLI